MSLDGFSPPHGRDNSSLAPSGEIASKLTARSARPRAPSQSLETLQRRQRERYLTAKLAGAGTVTTGIPMGGTGAFGAGERRAGALHEASAASIASEVPTSLSMPAAATALPNSSSPFDDVPEHGFNNLRLTVTAGNQNIQPIMTFRSVLKPSMDLSGFFQKRFRKGC